MNDTPTAPVSDRYVGLMAAASAGMLWISQPPLQCWPVALIALVPWLRLILVQGNLTRRGYGILYAASVIYWLVSLQGLRHAHPAMYLCWIALAAYLAIYHVLFIGVSRRFVSRGIPLIVAAPLVWVALELVRNYMLTGISAAMLGHTMADVAVMIQIADLFGSYGVGLVLVAINVTACLLLSSFRHEKTGQRFLIASIATAFLVAGTIGYGINRLAKSPGKPLATFALIQRDEEVVYEQSIERETEMFQNYARQSIQTVADSTQRIDAVVWPESMFTGGSPWMTADDDAAVPPEASMSPSEFQQAVWERQQSFKQRSGYVQTLIAAKTPGQSPPHLVAGCGVVHYADSPQVFSGVIHIAPDGSVADWYGKTHLVMFGEYIAIAPYIPGLRSLVPPSMGLRTGAGAKPMQIGNTTVAPNICIETAVERVTVQQMASLYAQSQMPDVVVTVTNDGWFDDSSVIEHHLRCAQLVAVATRRPVLSAANNGPTAWIDSRGQIVARLPTGTEGALIATPKRETQISLYVLIGDWPARICAMLCGIALIRWKRKDRQSTNADDHGTML